MEENSEQECTPTKEKQMYIFNEQTNYVSARKIIAVWWSELPVRLRIDADLLLDLLSMRQRRPGCSDGPDNSGSKFVDYRR